MLKMWISVKSVLKVGRLLGRPPKVSIWQKQSSASSGLILKGAAYIWPTRFFSLSILYIHQKLTACTFTVVNSSKIEERKISDLF